MPAWGVGYRGKKVNKSGIFMGGATGPGNAPGGTRSIPDINNPGQVRYVTPWRETSKKATPNPNISPVKGSFVFLGGTGVTSAASPKTVSAPKASTTIPPASSNANELSFWTQKFTALGRSKKGASNAAYTMLRRRRAVYRGGDVNVYTKKEKERGNITGSAPVAASAVVTPPATPAVVRDASAETSRSGGFGGVAKVATVAAAATLATAVVRSRGSRSGPLPVGAKATAKTPNVEAPIRPEGVKYNSQGKRISLIRPQNRALEALNNPPVTSKPTPAPAGAGTTARDAATNRREKGRSRA